MTLKLRHICGLICSQSSRLDDRPLKTKWIQPNNSSRYNREWREAKRSHKCHLNFAIYENCSKLAHDWRDIEIRPRNHRLVVLPEACHELALAWHSVGSNRPTFWTSSSFLVSRGASINPCSKVWFLLVVAPDVSMLECVDVWCMVSEGGQSDKNFWKFGFWGILLRSRSIDIGAGSRGSE